MTYVHEQLDTCQADDQPRACGDLPAEPLATAVCQPGLQPGAAALELCAALLDASSQAPGPRPVRALAPSHQPTPPPFRTAARTFLIWQLTPS